MSRNTPSTNRQETERKVIGRHIITPPATFHEKKEIENIQARYRDRIQREINILKAIAGNVPSSTKEMLEKKAAPDSRIEVMLYKKLRKEGHRNNKYSNIPGIKMYVTSSGLLYVTDERRFPRAQINKSDFEKIEHDIWLLQLAQGIYVQAGFIGVNGEEITVNHTIHASRGPIPSRQFTIPIKDLYRIEGITIAEPDLWQNPSYTWDFKPKKSDKGK